MYNGGIGFSAMQALKKIISGRGFPDRMTADIGPTNTGKVILGGISHPSQSFFNGRIRGQRSQRGESA
jgi:hypothetical protein